MPNKMTIFLLLKAGICNSILTEPKTHQISILKTNIASFIRDTHGNAWYFGISLLAN